jgi:DNA-binding transcriptional LysR family regulator
MFEATARLGSFSRAAEELFVTESAVCRQVIALEERVGVPLFLRNKKRLTLTSEGVRYAAEVRTSLGELASATEGVIGRRRGKEVVEVAAVPAFATQWLVPRMRDFLRKNRGIQLHLFSRVDPLDLVSSKFDVAIYSGTTPWTGYSHCKIVDEGDSVAVCAPSLEEEIAKGNWDSIFNIGLLHLESRPDAWIRHLESCGKNRPEARLGHRFELFSMVVQAATTGLGIALVPRIMVEESLVSGTLRELDWCSPPPCGQHRLEPCSYFASWKPSGNVAVQALADWLATLDFGIAAINPPTAGPALTEPGCG